MKKMRKALVWCLMVALLVSMLMPCGFMENYKAETSYTNAMEFFHSTGDGQGKHIEVVDGTIYFATNAKLAHTYSARGFKYYNTVGYDVTLTGGGKSVVFSVKRGGSLEEVPDSRAVDDYGYEYLLYRIPTKKIFELASKADPANAPTVLAASEIKVQMDAIITVRQNGVQGSIVEDGKGGIIEYEENGAIYHLKNEWELAEASSIFNGTKFETYIEIRDALENYQLSVYYAVNGTPTHIAGASTTVTMNSNYKKTTATIDGVTVPYVLCTSTKPYVSTGRVVNQITILKPSSIDMSKTGYHLDANKEWITDKSTPVSANTMLSKDVAPDIGFGDRNLVLYANWKPNTYTVVYNANGGSGTMAPSSMTYDDPNGRLRVNGFYRTGYTFLGWSTNSSATTAQYSDQQGGALNLTSTNKGTVTLYAVWKPCVYQLTTEKGEGTGGTDTFYEKYENGFYSDKACGNGITKITVPALRGHTFTGYFNNMIGTILVVDANGNIKVKNDFFKENAMLYATYEANKYQVTYDMQGGKNGSTSKEATFNQLFPIAKAPTKDGASFQGYYTKPNGQGERIYNKFMATDTYYTDDHDVTVYAHWTDDVPPTLTFTANYDSWTNKQIVLTAEAEDAGSGLKKVCIYLVKADGSESLVAQKNGTGETELNTKFTNETVGITRYKAITEDMNGNTAESYCVAYYDITAPTGVVVEADDSFGQFKFELDITDIDIGD